MRYLCCQALCGEIRTQSRQGRSHLHSKLLQFHNMHGYQTIRRITTSLNLQLLEAMYCDKSIRLASLEKDWEDSPQG